MYTIRIVNGNSHYFAMHEAIETAIQDAENKSVFGTVYVEDENGDVVWVEEQYIED